MASSIRCVGLNVHMKVLRDYKLHYSPCGMDEMQAALDKRGEEIVRSPRARLRDGVDTSPFMA